MKRELDCILRELEKVRVELGEIEIWEEKYKVER
jgi:hypothetical protein